VADPKILKRGRKTIYQLRPHLSQMSTTKYMPFTRKKAAFLKKYEPVWGGRPPPPLPPLNAPLEATFMSACLSSVAGYDISVASFRMATVCQLVGSLYCCESDLLLCWPVYHQLCGPYSVLLDMVASAPRFKSLSVYCHEYACAECHNHAVGTWDA